MILKSQDLSKNITRYNLFLFHGANEGLKEEIIKNDFKPLFKNNSFKYFEKEILSNIEGFYNEVLSKSFFEKEKLIIINRATDKIRDLIEEIIDKKISDLIIVLNANILEKKSKIRNLFEKNKEIICVPFYEDNSQTLSTMVNNFFKEKKIPISRELINLITNRSRGDRQNLNNELKKIDSYIENKSTVNSHDIMKLTNLAENYEVSELIDSCLSKNKTKTIRILNENTYSLEDCILIIRSFLTKSKRLFKLCKDLKHKKNIDLVISNFKPPIFWKDKEVVKQQMQKWSYENVEKLIYEINEIELLTKKYSNNSINILSNFIIEQSNKVSN